MGKIDRLIQGDGMTYHVSGPELSSRAEIVLVFDGDPPKTRGGRRIAKALLTTVLVVVAGVWALAMALFGG